MSSIPRATFSASYDGTAKILSGVVCVSLIAIAVMIHSPLEASIAAAILLASWAWSPLGYAISDEGIVIRRPVGHILIRTKSIQGIRAATGKDFDGCIRLFASGGLFGYFGIFRTSSLGKSHWYMTNRDNAVVIFTNSGTALVSPDDVDGFLTTVRASGVTQLDREMFPAVEGGSGGFGAPLILGIVFVVVTAAFAGVFLYKPGPPAYTLTSESLAIQDRFYPVTVSANDVDVAKVRVVDINAEPYWRPATRTNGFGTEHYHSGWFRTGGGQEVRAYRADGTRLLLLPPKRDGSPVLLDATDPDKLLADLHQKWGARN